MNIEQVGGRKAHDPTRPNPQKKQVIKNGRLENSPRHKKPKVHGRTYRPISRSRQMHKQQAKKVKHAQDPGTTNLYPANIGNGESWVKGNKGHALAVGRGKKPILGLLLKLFQGKYPVEMICNPKKVRMSWKYQVHAMRDRKRESTHTVMGRKVMTSKQTKQPSLSGRVERYSQHRKVVRIPTPDKGS